jgi:hypothetical protein
MNAVATTTISIFRGSEEDAHGDAVDSDTAIATGIPASLIEGRPREVNSATAQTPRVVRTATLRVAQTTDIRRYDRIKDETTGTFYRVDDPTVMANPAWPSDLRVDLTYE